MDANNMVVHRQVFTLLGWDEALGTRITPFSCSVLAEVPQGASASQSHCACCSTWLCLGLGRRIPYDRDFGDAGV